MFNYKKILGIFFILMITSACTSVNEDKIIKPKTIEEQERGLSNKSNVKKSEGEEEQKEDKERIEYIYIDNPSKKMLEQNEDYTGWISIENTSIDEPIVKGEDNDFYLNHNFNKEEDKYGTVFMDYRNIGFEFSHNTILYGHNAKNGLRFGPIHGYKDKPFAFDASTITIQTLYDTYTYDVFAFYFDLAEPKNIQTKFTELETFSQYIQNVSAKSMYDYGIEVTENDQILTLVTCSYDIDDGRYFIHAKKR